MKVTEGTCEVLVITEVKNLDPVTIFIQNFSPGKGSITIRCWNSAWYSYWPGMGDGNLQDFFCSCDNQYLLKNLVPHDRMYEFDSEGFSKTIKEAILKNRKDDEIDKDGAKEHWDWYNLHKCDLEDCNSYGELHGQFCEKLSEILGDDYYYDLPTTYTHEANWVIRIIESIREAFKQGVPT